MTITLEQVRETLKSVVEDFGRDTKYAIRYEEITGEEYDNDSTCRYQLGGTPACIVGVALHRLGVPLEPQWDKGLGLTADFLPVPLTDDALEYLRIAQSKQDAHFTWGYAYDAAENEAAK